MSNLRAYSIIALAVGGVSCRTDPPDELSLPYVRPTWVDPVAECGFSAPRSLPPFRASDTVSAPGAKYDPQPQNAWLARRVPGGWAFGPMVDSIRNTTRLWMREPGLARAALAVLDTLAPHGPLIAATYPDSIVPSRTRWDYAELYDWMEYLRGSAGEAKGVTFTAWSIDPLASRLMFGVETVAMVPEAIAWFESKRIPCRLVTLRVMGKITIGD